MTMSARPSPATFRRPLDGIFSISTFLRDQTSQVKPLKNALYNVLVIGGLGLIFGVALVLWPFFKPMLWSFLFGAVLFPAKRNISHFMYNWLDRLENEERPFLFSIVIIPLEGLEAFGQTIVTWIIDHLYHILISGGLLFVIKILLAVLPSEFFGYVLDFMIASHTLFSKLSGTLTLSMICVLIFVYCASVLLLWTPALSTPFMIANHCLWVAILGYFCSFLGALQIPVFIASVTYCFIGFLYSLRDAEEEKKGNFLTKCIAVFGTQGGGDGAGDESRVEDIRPTSLIKDDKESLESDQYFKILFYSCLATIIWKHTWLIPIGLISTSIYIFGFVAKKLGLSQFLAEKHREYSLNIEHFIADRRTVLLPLCFPGVLKLNAATYKLICNKSKSYVDDLASILVILLLVFAIIFASVFFAVQIYSETIAVAQLGGNLVNRTLTYRPELIEMLPIDMQSMDDVIENAHKYGRSTIEKYVDSVFNGTDQATKLKQQILTVWDRLIQSYLDRNTESGGVGPRVGSESIYDSLGEIVTNPSAKEGVIEWAKSNFGMLIEVGDSIWLVVKTNINLLMSAFGTFFSIILGGGHAVIKFLFHSIIFFTCLYYLLQSSRHHYAPIAMNMNSQWGSRITTAIEDSISSVLVATLKLTLFHCLFTWLTHTVFGAHIVYLPSVLAALLAAAPFLETYWCTLPAFLDLWLSQDRFWLACLLFLIHFIVPSNFNPIIHSEIKGGGHPYLTGLSIAGGMYLLGLEGAVLGPLLLCLLVVLFDITKSALKDSPRTPNTRQNSIDVSASHDIYGT